MLYKCDTCNKVEKITEDNVRCIITEVGKINNSIFKELNVYCDVCGREMVKILEVND